MADPINAALPPTPPVDLTNCDREPIHIPGSVQSHAVMLVIQEPGLTVRHASANAPDRVGLPMTEILGVSLASLLPAAAFDHLRKNVLVKSLEGSPNYLPATRVGRSAVEFEAQVIASKGC